MAELADDWPSLAPIRTPCSISSSSSYYYHEPNTFSNPFPLIQKADHYNVYYNYTYQSPPSSSSSHVSFLHSTSTKNSKGQNMLSKCFPPRPHGFPKQCMSASPGGDVVRRSRGGVFRSAPSFLGPQGCRSGSICGIVTSSSAPMPPTNSGALKLGHSGPLKGNAFTLIPSNVVGKKKPPDYLSDEPTSPEVTCMGRVRRSKHSRCTWDALLNSSEKLYKKKKKSLRNQIEYPARRILDHDLQPAIPRPLVDPPCGATPKWKKMISFFKDIKGLHLPHRKLRQEDLVIDLSRLRNACSAADRDNCAGSADDQEDENAMHQFNTHGTGGTSGEVLYICHSGEGEEDFSIVQEEGGIDHVHTDAPPPPPNCLLLMRNMSGRSKVFHNQDDTSIHKEPDPHLIIPALKVITSLADHKDWNKKQAFYFWKSKKPKLSSSENLVKR